MVIRTAEGVNFMGRVYAAFKDGESRGPAVKVPFGDALAPTGVSIPDHCC